jgi:ubiquinone/menaquinone biosynthesis C-methylase UbiE
MKRDWNARARENAMHYVASSREEWSLAEFLESGRESVDAEVVPDLELIAGGRDPKQLRVLEIGCGMGRMTKHLADIFGEVHGIDVSGEMVARAREVLSDTPNAFVYETSGEDLRLFPDRFFDFVFSFIVLQHVPFREVVLGYLREAYRTLRPGGVFKFQVMGVVVEGERDTWVGVGFEEDELRRHADELGFEVLRTEGAGTQYFWNWWKSPGSPAPAAQTP